MPNDSTKLKPESSFATLAYELNSVAEMFAIEADHLGHPGVVISKAGRERAAQVESLISQLAQATVALRHARFKGNT